MSPVDPLSRLLDDSSSFTESVLTASSSSTTLGPGAITGRFLKAVGGKSLDLFVSLVIRRRLAVIKQTLERNPHILRHPQSTSEWEQMNGIHTDLKELCRDDYSLSIRRTAADLVRDITLITRPVPMLHLYASPTNDQWEVLLARIQRHRGFLLEPLDYSKGASSPASHQPNLRAGPGHPPSAFQTGLRTGSSEDRAPVISPPYTPPSETLLHHVQPVEQRSQDLDQTRLDSKPREPQPALPMRPENMVRNEHTDNFDQVSQNLGPGLADSEKMTGTLTEITSPILQPPLEKANKAKKPLRSNEHQWILKSLGDEIFEFLDTKNEQSAFIPAEKLATLETTSSPTSSISTFIDQDKAYDALDDATLSQTTNKGHVSNTSSLRHIPTSAVDEVISPSKGSSRTYKEHSNALVDENSIQAGGQTKGGKSHEVTGEPLLRKTLKIIPRLFRSRRSKSTLPRSLDVPSPDTPKPFTKVLVLGAGGVGKSTIVRQLRVIHAGVDDAEFYCEIIINNLIESMKAILLLEAVKTIQLDGESSASEDYMEAKNFVISLPAAGWVDFSDTELLYLGQALRTLWSQPWVREYARRINADSILPDSVEYLFNSVDRICTPNYVPTRDDIMRTRIRTIGIHETWFNVGLFTWRLIDMGGERSERKKWIHCLGNATAVLFVVALSDYNKTLYEDHTVNCMHESLALFKHIVNAPWFTNTLIILLFNKADVFKEELKVSPLKDWMPEYEGDSYDDALKFFEQKFISLVLDEKRPLPVHYVSAVDAAEVSEIFQTIQDEVGRHYEEQMSLL